MRHALQRNLTAANTEALDRVLARPTAPAQVRLTMESFARELRAWLQLPAPAAVPDALAEVVERARISLQAAAAGRDAAAERDRLTLEAAEELRRLSSGVVDAVAGLDR